jgi:hypothetical protein
MQHTLSFKTVGSEYLHVEHDLLNGERLKFYKNNILLRKVDVEIKPI